MNSLTRAHLRVDERDMSGLKHGSCSGLAPDLYFAEEARLMKGKEVKSLENALFIHASLPMAGEHSNLRNISVEDVMNGSRRKVAVKASKDCKLQELTLCFERTMTGIVGKQIDCPKSIMRKRHTTRCAAVLLETDSSKCSAVEGDLLKSIQRK